MRLHCAAALLLLLPAAAQDLYEVLGVAEDASDKDIKSAYRSLSLKYHPDKGGDASLFQDISAAYEVLSDGEKRALYDAGGLQAVEKAGKTDMFGRPAGVPKGEDVSVTVRVPLAEVYNGGNATVHLTRRVVCRGCAGDVATPRCAQCGPTCPPQKRMIQQRMGPGMVIQREVEEPSSERCADEPRSLSFLIERGQPEGHVHTFERAGEQTPGMIAGDVRVIVQTEPHAAFVRNGDDLELELPISLRQALLGFSRELRHLDGRAVVVAKEGVSSPGEVVELADEGMPRHGTPSERGTLRVRLGVKFPTALTESERQFVAANFRDEHDHGASSRRPADSQQ